MKNQETSKEFAVNNHPLSSEGVIARLPFWLTRIALTLPPTLLLDERIVGNDEGLMVLGAILFFASLIPSFFLTKKRIRDIKKEEMTDGFVWLCFIVSHIPLAAIVPNLYLVFTRGQVTYKDKK